MSLSSSFLFIFIFLLVLSIQHSHGQWGGSWQMERCYGRYERYNNCATTCPDTCEDIRRPNPMKICTLMCRSGCECIRPYVRLNQYAMSPCVHPVQCQFLY